MGQICKIFEILNVQIVYVFLCIGTPRTMLFQGGGDCNTLVLTPFALQGTCCIIVINCGEELKEKAPPSIWLCMFRQEGSLSMVYRAIQHIIILTSCKYAH